MQTIEYDYLVIGSGLAGLTFALETAAHGRVCILTKGVITESNTSWAQGGIAAAVGEADSWELHEEDTLIAGAGLCDRNAVRFLVQEAPSAIEWLQTMGARFDFNGEELELGREGGHSRHRIVKHADKTGWEIERAVSNSVEHTRAIEVIEHAFVTELLMVDGRCMGAVAHLEGVGVRVFVAKAVMLATGGCGKLYQHTTNPSVATADGLALASHAGAQVQHMEFMQFHPTTLFHPQMRSFLVTEAVRGAGGTLRNHLGRRFMYDYDARLELAPRDVVARAIDAEMKKHGTWCVYLDTTHLTPETIESHFPTIRSTLASIGLEIDKEWIPVVPAQHYSCGGVVTDLNGQTGVPGLFAAGEVASTGVHGANRLASNSLLEALVFARAAARKALGDRPALPDKAEAQPTFAIAEVEAIRIRRTLQRSMTQHVAIVRNNAGLQAADKAVTELRADFEQHPEAPFSSYSIELANLLVAAKFVVSGAIARKENVGLHYNEDLA
jgi:L-aspartate oxidase